MTEKPSGPAPDTSLIDEAQADRRRAPELDLSKQAYPTPEQNQKARSHPGVAPIFNEMLRNREDARVRWIEHCRRRSGVVWSGLSDPEPPPILTRTFDQMIDEAIVRQARRAAYAVSPRGLMAANMAAMKHPAAAVLSLSSEVESCISRGLTGRDRIAARERLGEIQHQLESMSWEASKALAILDVLDAEKS